MTKLLFSLVTPALLGRLKECGAGCGVHVNALQSQESGSLGLADVLGASQIVPAEIFRVGRSGLLGGCIQGKHHWESEFIRFVTGFVRDGHRLGVTTEIVTGDLRDVELGVSRVVESSLDDFQVAGPRSLVGGTCVVIV